MSNTLVVCARCWALLRASRMLLGRRVSCPRCKERFRVGVLLREDLTILASVGPVSTPTPGLRDGIEAATRDGSERAG
jgi:DNA-directed RNA polymerase subunit RPC12/RpoP